MESEFLPISSLSAGMYQMEIVELSTFRHPFLMLVWILEIENSDLSGKQFKYSYRADESPALTSENFQAVGINESNLASILEQPELIAGVKVKVAVEENSIRFIKSNGLEKIEPGKLLKSPF